MKIGFSILSLTVSVLIFSCQNQAKFEITNQTSVVIDSISIFPDKSFKEHYISLMPGETKRYTTDMSETHTDGVFAISYKFQAQTMSHYLGYYSNGNQLEKLIKIALRSDTILLKHIY
jgi:hypothetical protein